MKLFRYLPVRYITAIWLFLASATASVACPFCTPVRPPLAEQLQEAQAAVIAALTRPPKLQAGPPGAMPSPPAQFIAADYLAGATPIKSGAMIEAFMYDRGKIGQQYLLIADGEEELQWQTPVKVSKAAVEYIKSLDRAPADGADRLAYFLPFLYDEDKLIAQDAYEEFAKAPYQAVAALGDKIDRQKLLTQLMQSEVDLSRRRLYFTLLGVCGQPEDIPLLEKWLKAGDTDQRKGLDALIACYLTLKGSAGLPLIEQLYLANQEVGYTQCYSAVMAIRFHGTETDRIPRKQLVKALRHLLDRPQLADMIIPDLARWEDWESMDRLVEVFKKADPKTNWARTPVVNFLRVCPLPNAKKRLEDLKKLDPQAVEDSFLLFPELSPGNVDEQEPQDS